MSDEADQRCLEEDDWSDDPLEDLIVEVPAGEVLRAILESQVRHKQWQLRVLYQSNHPQRHFIANRLQELSEDLMEATR